MGAAALEGSHCAGSGSLELFPAAGAHFSLGLVKALRALVLEQLKPVWFYNEERSVENKSKAT